MMQVRVEVRELPGAPGAQAGAQAGAQVGNAPVAPGPPVPDGPPDGTFPTIHVDPEGGIRHDGPPDGVVEMVSIMFICIAAAVILSSLFRALGKRWERGAQQPAAIPAETAMRLQRIEQAVDSIAIEVERISEGQRFTAKLLADRVGEPARSFPPNG